MWFGFLSSPPLAAGHTLCYCCLVCSRSVSNSLASAMLAYRRTSSFALKSLARTSSQSQREAGRRSARCAVGVGGVDSTARRPRFFSSLPDHIVVGMPALSPTMTHGNIGSWGKQAGDEIAAGDVVCEVETDKATVDFDAQDDSFMAKILVATGTQDIPVGTPIFVTVEDAESVAAFKDFTAEAEAAAPAAENPAPVVEEKVAAAPATLPPPAAAAAVETPPPVVAAPVPAAPASVEAAPVASSSSPAATLVFKRDWGSGVSGSPLAHRLSVEQKKYVERFGSTLQLPLKQ